MNREFLNKGDTSCHVAMEQVREEKAPVPVEVWALAAPENEKVAAKDAAREKAAVAARDKVKGKVAVRQKGKAVDRISERPYEKGA
jgi:hypothetical protein